MIFKLLKREIIHSNNWYNVFKDDIINTHTNMKYEYYTISFNSDSVCAVIRNKEKKILFVTAYRYPDNNLSLEIPAGSVEQNEDIIKAAIRECKEETGYNVQVNEKIFRFKPNNGVSNQNSHILFGYLKDEIQDDFDKNEVNKILWLSKEEILDKIKNNEITDGFTLSALFIYFINEGYIM